MFNFLKNLFSRNVQSEDDDDCYDEPVTRDEALACAKAEALRGFEDRGETIVYITFIPSLNDFFFVEYTQHNGGWVSTARVLQNHERLPGETIPDSLIVELARAGNMLAAIARYRAKYDVGLAEGKAGVDALVRSA